MWSKITPLRGRQIRKAGLVWKRHQLRITLQDCVPGNPLGRPPSRPSEEKLDGKRERVEYLPMDELLIAVHNRNNWRRICVSSFFIPHTRPDR
ncbi:hypothetical protein DPMN_129874 [Dreissena polymorpha]|uniref:Uncharacterized protein n=1 Tax=Dreissena polymorpha TaxID=45954 RepID=A0A9D4K1D3_DREPO|nr:hypothetical protein DPMN_129874 [Dreissena polymorpha]